MKSALRSSRARRRARAACIPLAALFGACASHPAPAPAAVPIQPVAVAAPEPVLPPLPDDGRPPDPAPRPAEAASVAPVPAALPQVLLVDEPPAYSSPPAAAADGAPHGRSHGHGRNGRPYHPAPRVVIDVSGGSDPGFAADAQRTLRNLGYWPVRRCYEGGLRRDQRIAGKVSLELAAAPAATHPVLRATAVASTLRDSVVVACVAREVAELALGPGNGSTTLLAEVKLSTGDDPVGVAAPVQDAARLRQALRASWPDVERCYGQALSADASAGGRMELHFRVLADGTVAGVEEGESRFAAGRVTQCVLGVYRAARLPAGSTAHAERAFVYPLQLESAQTLPRQAIVDPGSESAL